MIILKQKDFDELLDRMRDEEKIFLAGCAECATACKVGGEEELRQMEQRLTEAGKTVTGKHVFDTACRRSAVRDGVKAHQDEIDAADAILVLACGTGVQSLGDRLEAKQVHPGAESLFVGEIKALGRYEEKCSVCNDCLLEMTDGICPVTRCAKGLLNGPCGGYTEDGKCEVDPDKDCAWLLIYERLKERGHLDKVAGIQDPHDHSGHHHPRAYRWPKPERPKKTKPQEEPA